MQEVYLINIRYGRSKEDYTTAVESKEIFDLACKTENMYRCELPKYWVVPEDYEDNPEDYTLSEAIFCESVELRFPVKVLDMTDLWGY